MKKLKFLKTILSLLLIVSTIFISFSCDNKTKETDETVNSDITEEIATKKTYNYKDYDRVKDFEIIQVDDGYRLKFNDTGYYEQAYRSDHLVIWLKSIDEIYDGLIYGTLSDGDKIHIFDGFPRDDNGIVIPDPYNLYVPILPEDCSVFDNEVSVRWKGSTYHHDMALISNKYDICLGAGVTISILTYDNYNEELKKETDIVKDYPDSMWTHENGKDSIIYSIEGETFKREQVRYTVSNENKTMLLIKNYIHYEEEARLKKTTAYYTSNGAYFTISFLDAFGGEFGFFTDGSSIDPEWAFEFDVEKYVPENT